MQIEFLLSATRKNQLPPANIPEIAFVGRSNAGKSTLINAIFGIKNLARTSKIPGRTQWINFFVFNEKSYFVDLPGYGFSKTAKEERVKWQRLMEDYLDRPNIQLFIFAFDARRELDSDDLFVLRKLLSGRTVFFVLTKVDKLKKNELRNAVTTIRQTLSRNQKTTIEEFFTFSKLQSESSKPLADAVFSLPGFY